MNSSTSSLTASGRSARTVWLSNLHSSHTRMYKFGEHGATFHTHIGRYSFNSSRILYVAMTLGDLIFTTIDRHEFAKALWAYRHDSSLTIVELKGSYKS